MKSTLEAQTDAVGAFTFVRIEDGAWSKKDKNKFYFVTTGSGAPQPGNVLGRAYQVRLRPEEHPRHDHNSPSSTTVTRWRPPEVTSGSLPITWTPARTT